MLKPRNSLLSDPAALRGRRFVAIDRDGTLLRLVHYLSDPEQVELLPGAAAAIRRLQALQLGVIVMTNQSPVGQGLFDDATVHNVNNRMLELLSQHGANLDAIYYCPHRAEDNCPCRKPDPGMLYAAAGDFELNVSDGIVIGDRETDIQMGTRLGLMTFLVRTGYGQEVETNHLCNPDYVVDDLYQAANQIEQLLT